MTRDDSSKATPPIVLAVPSAVAREKAALMALLSFLVIAPFWMLKPLRTSGAIKAIGPDLFPLLQQGIVVLVPFVLTFYTTMTCFLSRERLVYLFTSLFIAGAAVFWALLRWSPTTAVYAGFFLYLDVYMTVMVTLLWTYVNDIYEAEEAKQYYGFIGAGGLLGGIAGSAVSGWGTEVLGDQIVLVAACLLLPILGVTYRLTHLIYSEPSKAACERRGGSMFADLTEGIAAVAGSRYLLGLVVIVAAYEIVSVSIDYQLAVMLTGALEERDAMAAYQGKLFFGAQVAALAIQLSLTSVIQKRCGVVVGLLILPLCLLLGSSAFLVAPTLMLVSLLNASEIAFGQSIHLASKEILYVPLDAVAKFKGKAVIDMVVVRTAKALGGGLLLAYALWLRDLGLSYRLLACANIVFLLIWVIAVVRVGRVFERGSGGGLRVPASKFR